MRSLIFGNSQLTWTPEVGKTMAQAVKAGPKRLLFSYSWMSREFTADMGPFSFGISPTGGIGIVREV